MRAPAVSFAKRFAAALLAVLLTFALVPPSAFAKGEGGVDFTEPATEDAQEASILKDAEGADAVPVLASGLTSAPSSFVSADVAFGAEPIIGSFTVGGLTFAVAEGANVELVGVPEAGGEHLELPELVAYGGVEYPLTSISAYAFYLSGVTSVKLPVSVANVDDRAFRSSDVASVTVADGNALYSSFDGALYSAHLQSLLLIPEGKQGTVLLPKEAELAPPSVFSHCPLVQAISVEEGSAAFASEDGLLYDASLMVLLRVPAGATEIAIREGCTTIAAGALEACVSLVSINAPASVMSISPYAFERQPETVMAPVAVAAVEADAEDAPVEAASQLSAMVALSAADDDLPEVDPIAVKVTIPQDADASIWQLVGSVEQSEGEGIASLLSSSSYAASSYTVTIDPYWHSLYQENGIWNDATDSKIQITWTGNTPSAGVLTVYNIVWLTCSPGHLGLNEPGSDGRHNYMWFSSGTVGWTLKGFRQDVNSTDILNCVEELSSDRHFIALWEANKYTVSFNVNGGQGNVPASVTATYDSTLPAINANKPTKAGYTFAGWYDTNAATGGTQYYDANNKAVSGKTWDKAQNTTLYARWTANSYTVEYWNKAGTTKLSSDTGFKYDTARTLAAKPTTGVSAGYTAAGWAASTNQSTATYAFSSSQKNLATSGTKKLYLAETPNTYVVSFNANGGSGGQSANVTATYDTAMPAISTTSPTKAGYTFGGWYDTSAATGGTQYYTAAGASARTWNKTGDATLFARWAANSYTIAFDTQGGSAVAPVTATYDADVVLPGSAMRDGYVLKGWNTRADGSGASYQAGATLSKPNFATSGTATLYAQWEPVVSADLPLEVEARVDVLGLEEQEEAEGYIESRCGEPLTVASIELSPLAGAVELFGADSVASVSLEVLAAGSASPDARFALDAAASQAPAVPGAFRMASYGSSVPISYRFAIPDELLSNLAETTKPVCQVAYTVALA